MRRFAAPASLATRRPLRGAPLVRATSAGARAWPAPKTSATTTTRTTTTSTPLAHAALALAVLAATTAATSSDCESDVKHARGAGATSKSVNFIADAVEAAWPCLVHVASVHATFFGQIGSGGSGFVVHEDGFIATNAHVVAHSAGSKLTVTFTDGSVSEATVWAMDAPTDLALIRVERLPESARPAKIGSSASLRHGEFVAALGSPMNLTNSVTSGVVSSTARHANELGLPSRVYDFIQTDASINSGNSGGPLVNMNGEVVGINTMKAAGPEGISFSIPVDVAWPVLEQLREHRRVRRPYLGLRMVTIDDHVLAFERRRGTTAGAGPPLPEGVEEGVLVVQVAPGSPSERAGFKPGDVIVSIDGVKVRETGDVVRALGYDAGKRIRVAVKRERGAEKVIEVATEEMPSV